MYPYQEKLYLSQNLNQKESEELFNSIFRGEVTDIELSSLLTCLKLKGETQSEIAGAALAMLKAASPLTRPDYDIGEIVGTGGDGLATINISTLSGILASTLGLKIAKHGNKAVSSKTGASDLLQAVGYNVNINEKDILRSLDEEGFAFIFAQHFHKAMRYAAAVRQSLRTRTIFNLLGPLTNPIKPTYELLGVYSDKLLEVMARTLHDTGVRRAFCVNGNGMDEIAPFGTTHYARLFEDGHVESGVLTRESFGITHEYTQADITGGNPEENRDIALAILSGKGREAHNYAIAVNLAALLVLGGKAATLKQGTELAMDAILSGAGLKKLERRCAISRGV